MPDLLLELFSEEIPARMQARAAADLERAVNDKLFAAGFRPEGVKAFATPRRLALVATGLPLRQADRKEEKKGPRVGAPQQAIDGFLKAAGLASIDRAEIRDDKKGALYVAMVEEKGRDTAEVIAGFMPEIIRGFPWPKSMRWGDGDLRWVRPLKRILCTFGGEIAPFSVDGIEASDATEGHRVMGPKEIRVRSFEKYEAALKSAFVELDASRRAETILEEARTLCRAQGLELIENKGLLAEVAGLVEWPVVRMGSFDAKFLDAPEEAISATMSANQKYFSVRDPKTGRLANKFVYVANIEAKDGGAASRAGYERVLTARLSDAWFLYRQDLKTPLAARIPALDQITFFEGLGSVGDKARRVAALAKEIAPLTGADPQLAEEAALLAKADLVTSMVKEFPELQGKIGRYYVLRQGAVAKDDARIAAIADAIRDHYRPLGAEDDSPTAPVSVAVALADKLDNLCCFWLLDDRPTGSRDPFALRRAALGCINIVTASATRLQTQATLMRTLLLALATATNRSITFARQSDRASHLDIQGASADLGVEITDILDERNLGRLNDRVAAGDVYSRADIWGLPKEPPLRPGLAPKYGPISLTKIAANLLAFFHDRLKVYLRDQGHRHDHIDAALMRPDGTPEDDLVLIVKKLEALEAFVKTDDGADLAAAFKRGANILKAEEKKGALGDLSVDPGLFQLAEEKALFAALSGAEGKTRSSVKVEDFTGAMAALSILRAPLDAFFDKVTVNADDPKLRLNRLALLQRLIAATATVADLSKLEG